MGDIEEDYPLDESGSDTSDDILVNGDLYVACEEERIEDVEKLLIEGTAINQGFEDGFTPLHAACKKINLELVQMLINRGADARITNLWKWTPMHTTCEFFWDNVKPISECTNIVKLLIDSGADVNATTTTGETPLHIACSEGLNEVAELLISFGADINAKTFGANSVDGGETPLHKTCSVGYTSLARLLIAYGADVNSADGLKRTPLHLACYSFTNTYSSSDKYNEFNELLLDNGADVNAVDIVGRTPICNACQAGCVTLVKLLLNRGANVNGTADTNPIKEACICGHVDVVKLLLRSGADVFRINIYRLASQIIRINQHTCALILQLLLQYTLNFNFESLLKTILSQDGPNVYDNIQTEIHLHIMKYHTPKTCVGSLRELCRDKVRILLRSSCYNTTRFIEAVESLEVPEDVKDIIFLRSPIN